MRRSTALVLVLVNGSVLAGAGYALTRPSPRSDCEEARAALRLEADEVCRRSGSSTRTSFSSGSWSGSDASTHASDRGGFGGSATHFSGGG